MIENKILLIPFKRLNERFTKIGRLKMTLIIYMTGFLADYLMTQWMLSNFDLFYESNQNLNPEMGLPIMVLIFVTADHIMPGNIFFDNFFYTFSVLQWAGPVQNLLVLYNITPGINFFYAFPIIFIDSYIFVRLINKE